MRPVAATPMSIIESITRKSQAEAREVFYNCVSGYIVPPLGSLAGAKRLHSADIIGIAENGLRIEARYYGGKHVPLIKHLGILTGPGLQALAAGVAAIGDIPLTPPTGFMAETLVIAPGCTMRVGPMREIGADRPVAAPSARP